ncbi:hypothetical protein AAC387_Pa08g1068 [Persea americana]
MDSSSKAISTPLLKAVKDLDFLTHLESYLAKYDGVDKLLTISRYAAKIALFSSPKPPLSTLASNPSSPASASPARPSASANSYMISMPSGPTTLLAYHGEGLYYFVEQLVWLSKTGLIDHGSLPSVQKISAWAELIGYVGSISL